MVSKIVIDVEELGSSQAVLGLSIDGRLIAQNLTPDEARRLVYGILERIAVLDIGENAAQHWATEFGRTRTH
jgi:hypothetical protein